MKIDFVLRLRRSGNQASWKWKIIDRQAGNTVPLASISNWPTRQSPFPHLYLDAVTYAAASPTLPSVKQGKSITLQRCRAAGLPKESSAGVFARASAFRRGAKRAIKRGFKEVQSHVGHDCVAHREYVVECLFDPVFGIVRVSSERYASLVTPMLPGGEGGRNRGTAGGGKRGGEGRDRCVLCGYFKTRSPDWWMGNCSWMVKRMSHSRKAS